MTKIGILTLGCRVNQYESQAIAEELENYGYTIVPFSQECDVYIINTCTVTSESDRKSKQMIGRALARKKENGDIIVCVIGCFTQNKKQNLKENDLYNLGDIDFIGGNADKSQIPKLLHEYICERKKNKINFLQDMDNVDKFDDISLKKSNNVRAYLKVQDGCNNFCTYCIVPIVRGRVRSKPIDAVLCDLKALRESGYDEVVFCGIEISAYGEDNGLGLLHLAEAARDTGFKRVRFGSLNPVLLNEEFVKKLSEIEIVMPHFHLSVQSADSKILNDMGRNYDAAQLQRGIDFIYKHFNDVTLSCDIICGFPGETEKDFSATCDFVQKNKIIHAHIFPYSRREGTVAANLANQLPTNVKKARCSELQNIADDTMRRIFGEYSGRHATVLIENKKGKYWFGHTENFMPVALLGNYSAGEFVPVILGDRFEKISDEISFIIA